MTQHSTNHEATAFMTRSAIKTWFCEAWLRFLLLVLKQARTEKPARSLASVHCAYWVVLSRRKIVRMLSNPNVARAQLLFFSFFDGDEEGYLNQFAAEPSLTPALNSIWGQCEGWAGVAKLSGFTEFVRTNQLKADAVFNAYKGESVHDIRSALKVSEALDRFALESSALDQEQFRAAYEHLLYELSPDLAA